MTENDKKIWTFVQDARSFIDYSWTSEKLEALKNEAYELLKQGQCSDINRQDKKGNTLLHYACMEKTVNLAYKILKLGANPYLKNLEGKTIFESFTSYHARENFFKLMPERSLDDTFIEKVSGIHPAYKQVLLETSAMNFCKFENVSQIQEFLEKLDLANEKNTLLLYVSSNRLKVQDCLKYYQESITDTPDNKVFFIHNLLQKCGKNFSKLPTEILSDFANTEYPPGKDLIHITRLMSYHYKDGIKNSEILLINFIKNVIKHNLLQERSVSITLEDELNSQCPELYSKIVMEGLLEQKNTNKSHMKI